MALRCCIRNETSLEQSFITTAQGARLEGDEAIEYIRTRVTEKFQQRSTLCTTIDKDESSGAMAPFSQREWERAEKRVPSSTSTGPDGIPIRLIKTLGPKSK
uniref:Putative tick transposon n=1 Tax=Rhipicephalus microplus TaxID=6941 RepID=A0A6G5AH08_RHIMP